MYWVYDGCWIRWRARYRKELHKHTTLCRARRVCDTRYETQHKLTSHSPHTVKTPLWPRLVSTLFAHQPANVSLWPRARSFYIFYFKCAHLISAAESSLDGQRMGIRSADAQIFMRRSRIARLNRARKDIVLCCVWLARSVFRTNDAIAVERLAFIL